MAEGINRAQVIKNLILKIFLRVGIGFILLLFLFFTAINLPFVQEKMVKSITDLIMEKVGHRATLKGVTVSWFDTIELHGLVVYDTKGEKMIEARTLDLDFHLFNLLANQSINFDRGKLDNARVTMTRNAPENQFNFTYFIDEIKEEFSRDRPKKEARKFYVKELQLVNSVFSLDNTGRDSLENSFDYNHFILKNLNGVFTDFIAIPGEIKFSTKNLSGYDSVSNLDVKRLSVNYHFTRQNMIFQNMKLLVGESNLENSMIFEYESPQALKDFVTNVKIISNIKKSLINLRDIGYFAPSLKEYDQYFRLKGFFEGQINRFNTKNIILEFGQSSRLEGYFNMYGLPRFFETFINANITKASINVYDLRPYLPQNELNSISKFERVNFEGRYSGFPNDFVSDGYFRTAIGDFDTDINVKINTEDKDASTYSGNLKTNNLNLGELMEDTATYQMMAFHGNVTGKGFSASSANVKVVADINRLGYKGYEYQDISTNAVLNKDFFSGELIINDPNLNFNGSMSIDRRGNQDQLVINAQVDTAYLQKLNLTDKQSFVRAGLDVNLQGIENRDFIGKANFKDLYVEYEERKLFLSNLDILSEKDSLGRSININSSLLDGAIYGDFDPISFVRDLGNFAREYWLNIQNNQEEISEYYASKKGINEYYYLDMEITLKDINPIIHLFEPDLDLSKGTDIIGSFTSGQTNVIEFESMIDKISYGNYSLRDNQVFLKTSNYADTSQIDAEISFHSSEQLKNSNLRFEDLKVDVDWHNNHIDFKSSIEQYNANNYVNLSGDMDLLADQTIINIDPSELKALNKTWQFAENNSIILKKRDYLFNNVMLYSENESVSVNGKISEDPNENLFISLKNLNLDNINPLISKELGGSINGFVDLRDYFGEKNLNSRLNVREFKVNKFKVGDIASAYYYDSENERFKTTMSLTSNDDKTLDLNGFIYPKEEEQLQLTAEFTNTNINILEPFYDEIISDLKGNLTGDIEITGRILKPFINGHGHVGNGMVTLDYQNVRYAISGDVDFDNYKMQFSNVSLTDIRGNKGTLSGEIKHNHFKDLKFNLDCSFKNFQVLNTTAKDNDLFYGTAYASGDLKIYGENKIINFDANAISNKDTKIFIPLYGSSEAVQEDFISFVKPKDTTDDDSGNDYFEFDALEETTLNFDFDFEVTPDAYCEIIFDLTAGDIIRGRGNGKLNIKASTEGDFEIYGNYDIVEGGYNFTLYNIINKEFEIHPDSRITWTGDPYHANLDIKASYRQLASLGPIIDVPIDPKPIELSRKYPTLLYLFIEGDMLSPNIDFDIEITDYPKNANIGGLSLENYVTAFYNKLESNEQELKRQVFSLIVLKNFSTSNAFNVSSTIENSVSELVSNQLSYWITQFDENLVVDIDVDLSTMSDEAFNTFQLRLSYSFLDGRLKVTRDGNFSTQREYDNPMSVIGDWTVEYLLTEDGKFRAKVYNKTNYNNFNFENTVSTSAGFSLMHTQSFDEFFKKVKKKHEEKKHEAEKEEEKKPESKPTTQNINAIRDEDEVQPRP